MESSINIKKVIQQREIIDGSLSKSLTDAIKCLVNWDSESKRVLLNVNINVTSVDNELKQIGENVEEETTIEDPLLIEEEFPMIVIDCDEPEINQPGNSNAISIIDSNEITKTSAPVELEQEKVSGKLKKSTQNRDKSNGKNKVKNLSQVFLAGNNNERSEQKVSIKLKYEKTGDKSKECTEVKDKSNRENKLKDHELLSVLSINNDKERTKPNIPVELERKKVSDNSNEFIESRDKSNSTKIRSTDEDSVKVLSDLHDALMFRIQLREKFLNNIHDMLRQLQKDKLKKCRKRKLGKGQDDKTSKLEGRQNKSKNKCKKDKKKSKTATNSANSNTNESHYKVFDNPNERKPSNKKSKFAINSANSNTNQNHNKVFDNPDERQPSNKKAKYHE